MQPIPCAIKKKTGNLTIEQDSIIWQAQDQSDKQVILLENVHGLQATPPTAAKLRIKLTTKDGKSTMFELGSPAEIESARNELQTAIKNYREKSQATGQGTPQGAVQGSAQGSGEPQPSEPSGSAGQPASQVVGQSGQSKPRTLKSSKKFSLEPSKLLHNLDLQRQVLKANPDLMKTFQQVVIVSNALTNEQFWSLRMQLLVTTAQELAQSTGSYNVLSTIKPITSGDNQVNINLTREKITDMFDQYPLIRKAYNESVPKISESEFWQRFFMSRLFLVLKGERVAQNHPPDSLLDPYIDLLHTLQQKQQQKRVTENSAHPAPLFMNVETNAMDNPQTYGNDITTLGPKSTRNLIRSMNGLSHRLLVGKNKKFQEDEDEVNKPEAIEEEIKLHDLETEENNDEGISLHVNLAQQSMDKPEMSDQALNLLSEMPPNYDLRVLLNGNENLNVLNKTEDRIRKLTPHPDSINVSDLELAQLSEDVMLLHATTTEFLKQFWHFYHTDKQQALQMREFLMKSIERIHALSNAGVSLNSVLYSVEHALKMPI